MYRLASISTRNVPGLPDVGIELQPLTALIGASGSGKSRLLDAIAWLVAGTPPLTASDVRPEPVVAAELAAPDGRRTVERGDGRDPEEPLPRLVYLPIRSRLPGEQSFARPDGSDATLAEKMVDDIAAETRAATTGQLLVIDEPELMLTPQAQRHLYRLLRAFTENGNQVIYATRAPALVDAVHHEEIVRLDISHRRLSLHRAPPGLLTDEERLRLAAEFDQRGEMFFATAVVLVEGQTERLSLPPIFRALGHDPDQLGISITEVGGKGNLMLAARVLAQLHIPHVIVHDSDRGRPGWRENAAIRQAAGRTPVIALDPDFEGVAGIHSHEDKVLHAWRRFSNAPPERVPEVFKRIVRTAVRLAARAGAEPSGDLAPDGQRRGDDEQDGEAGEHGKIELNGGVAEA
jgi:energy-coupling factor transporter ATP-binding protein EcfA2